MIKKKILRNINKANKRSTKSRRVEVGRRVEVEGRIEKMGRRDTADEETSVLSLWNYS